MIHGLVHMVHRNELVGIEILDIKGRNERAKTELLENQVL